jgi:hypothetical protein
MRIRDPRCEKFGSEIWDGKHVYPGSATLILLTLLLFSYSEACTLGTSDFEAQMSGIKI